MDLKELPSSIKHIPSRLKERREAKAQDEDKDSITRTLANEVGESEKKGRDAAWLFTALGAQVLDRTRTSIVIIPIAAVEVLERTQNSALAGAVGAGIFALFSGIVGETFGQALHRFPKTVARFADKYPSFVKTFADAVPGIEQKDEVLQAKESDDSHSLALLLAHD